VDCGGPGAGAGGEGPAGVPLEGASPARRTSARASSTGPVPVDFSPGLASRGAAAGAELSPPAASSSSSAASGRSVARADAAWAAVSPAGVVGALVCGVGGFGARLVLFRGREGLARMCARSASRSTPVEERAAAGEAGSGGETSLERPWKRTRIWRSVRWLPIMEATEFQMTLLVPNLK